MINPGDASSMETLREFSEALFRPEQATDLQVVKIGSVDLVDVNDRFQVAREGKTLVVRGEVSRPATKSAEAKAGDITYTVCFDDSSTEPTAFMRWDETRRDTGEGYSVPKRQRERVAKQLVELLN